MTDLPRRVTYVLPVFNEADIVAVFHDALVTATDERPDLAFEFVYVDDGSQDGSLDRLLSLREKDERVTVLSLARNFGHQLAVTAGIDAAHAAEADAVIVMDTDLQDPPAVSLELLQRWEAGADVVYAQRRSRQDTRFKRGTAAGFYWLLDRLAETPIPRNVGDFRLMDRRVVGEVAKYREHNRFLRGIVAQVGFRQEAVLFDRDERLAGQSKYPLSKMLRLAGDGIMGFSTQPLRLISHLGLLISGLSLVGIVYVLGVRLLDADDSVPGWAFLAVAMFFLGGVQLIVLGVIGSYVGRTYVEVLDRPLYSVALAARGTAGTSQPTSGHDLSRGAPLSPRDPHQEDL
ncbi:glycosyltransferase family 2 protein [Nocardioides sp. BP30]|uniref:glycosyltransferase family 2 protein n=1 Tax=Nocardioides sp. BP30 TaxID=3036374 RepID=UPI00246942C1|nr:glycosyltransferase family 2 protein [Nocardioides sp. BP30]WGL50845.1 glycosyltransferase family 2 protein [Nocardioides sp. BP30]